ncbi:hypothetical protein O6H91_02G147900 [Diphasiastrum complanatum]|uniref:Uncharacterized protein n=1 Tax=Diphasiastrum complanatum TaxID=34168 RepID=A0ACC2ELL1_DIPCM|nr:hypothetical protein O6H91_02G147900 [Diphasiastrum complanatum]
MSSPGDFYNSLPPVIKAYGTACVLTTLGYHLGIINPALLYFDTTLVLRHFQIWRVFTNFFFLGKFSINFGIRLLMLARYGVQLEKNAFDMRTADFLWMLILSILTMLGLAFLIPVFQFAFMGPTLVFMLLYLWSREFSNSKVNISGLVTLQAFYLPWAMLLLNTMFGSPPLPDLMGIAVGHLYYFVAVLHPGSRTSSLFKPPLWVHKLVAKWNKAGPQRHSPVQPAQQSGRAFSGRSYRLNQD